MFVLHTNFQAVFLRNLTDKIHYQIFDSLGRIVQVLVDNDGKTSTGVSRTDNEGNPVAGIDQVLAYTYNVKGEIIDIRSDNDVDGNYDSHEKLTLNANGQILQREFDVTNDGVFDKKEVYTLRPSGGYRNDDGSIVGAESTTFYNIIKEEDGSIKEVVSTIDQYQYDANGRWIGTKTDRLGNGSIDYVNTLELDALGQVKKSYIDTDGKDGIDRVETHTRDSNGFITKTEIDNGNNGSIDVVRTYQRDALGNALVYEVDNRDNGVGVDIRYVQKFDEYGNQISQQTYSYNTVTQQFDLTTSVERTFDEHNRAKTVKYPDHTVVYEYDEFGRTISNKAAEFNRDWRYKYNPDGTVAERSSYNSNGELENKQIYTEYYSSTRLSKAGETRDGNEDLVDNFIYYRNDNGVITNTLVDLANNGKGWDIYNFGDKGRISSLNVTQDLTTWGDEQLAELGNSLSLIRMTQGAAANLTINANVIAKISEGGLKIEGAQDKNDTLNLSGFTKASNSDIASYDKYTANINGEDLTLYVDTQINTVLG